MSKILKHGYIVPDQPWSSDIPQDKNFFLIAALAPGVGVDVWWLESEDGEVL
jgi:hypothetical protein